MQVYGYIIQTGDVAFWIIIQNYRWWFNFTHANATRSFWASQARNTIRVRDLIWNLCEKGDCSSLQNENTIYCAI